MRKLLKPPVLSIEARAKITYHRTQNFTTNSNLRFISILYVGGILTENENSKQIHVTCQQRIDG